ncbi:hypothetical protein BJ322DRAFT_1017415 [Thelephora terrestris]|uniref:Uncharacterized protein n=1 Tax=Thelephora terrestris TaxID=56493 RepID=A0A9P6LB16_9AGAM|nr:hypothetical protein BJ322DRAFT_1017415 [Thelephora terrestris]
MNNTSPRTIFLPSSGGYSTSRIVPESINRRRFPFRQYSIDEDGGLVCRSRNVSREARSRPYGAGVVPTRDLPPRSRTPVPSQSHAHPSESATAARTLNSIIPAIVQNPEAFRESIPTICAKHNINPTILESLVQNLESAQLVGNPPKDTDIPQAPDQPPVTSLTVLTPPFPPSSSPVPFKHERPFPTGARGATIWYTTKSSHDLLIPPSGLQVVAGTLYIHFNTSKKFRQIWLFKADAGWKVVNDITHTSHPSCRDRILTVRSDGTPSWVISTPAAHSHGRRFRK